MNKLLIIYLNDLCFNFSVFTLILAVVVIGLHIMYFVGKEYYENPEEYRLPYKLKIVTILAIILKVIAFFLPSQEFFIELLKHYK